MRKKKISEPVGKFRSKFEGDVAKLFKTLKVPFEYEPADKVIDYVKPETRHKYTTDFVVGDIYFECKGYLDADARKKMELIKKQHPEKRIVMVFMNPKLKINKRYKTTYADWCVKKGFEYCSIDGIGEILNTPR